MTGGTLLDAGRADFPRLCRALSRFFPGGLLGFIGGFLATTRFLAAATLFVDRLPRPFFGDAFGLPPLFVALFNVLGLALLLGRIFGFGSSRHNPFYCTRHTQNVPSPKWLVEK